MANTHTSPSQRSNQGVDEPWGFATLVNMFRRRLGLSTSIAVLVTVAAVVASLIITPTYKATADIKIEPTDSSAVVTQQTAPEASAENVVSTEQEVMTSRIIARAVVERLNLARDPEFNPPPSLLATMMGHKSADQADALEAVTDAILQGVSAEREGTTYIVALSFKSHDPRKAAMITNTFVQEYLRASLRMSTQSAAQQSTWLNGRLESVGHEVEAADSALAQYRGQTGLAPNSGAGGANITDQQIGPLTVNLSAAESDAAEKRSTYEAARDQMSRNGVDSVSAVINSGVVADLKRQRAEVQRELDQISTRYGARHPETLRVQQQLSGIDTQVAAEAQRIVNGLSSEARAAESRAASLRASLGQLKGQQASNSRLAVEASSLEREAEAKRNMYNQLAVSAQQANQQQQLTSTRGKLISPALPPLQPSFPNKPLFAAMGLLTGLVLALGVTLTVEVFDSRLRTAADIENGLGLSFIASIPELTKGQLRSVGRGAQPWDYIVQKPLSTYGEALRTIRSALTFGGPAAGGKVITITSSLPNEGKTLTAVSLARVMALSGDKVVLVDCDLRQNSLAGIGASAPTAGLVEVLTGAARLEDVVIRDTSSDLDILPLTKVTFTPRDVFNTQAMHDLLTTLRSRYQMIIMDAPPTLAVADARTLASLADLTIVVVRWQATPREAVRTALGHLADSGATIIGAVLSRVDLSSRAFGKGDASYFRDQYSSYYLE